MMTANQANSSGDRDAQVREMRRQFLDKARPSAEKYLSDARYNWLRPLSRRRLLVVVSTSVILAHSVALWFSASAFLTLPLLAAGWVGYSLLKWAVRGMADLPDELIDERMREVRNRHYRLAYVTLSSTSVLVLLTMWIGADARRIGWQPESWHLEAVFWAFLFFSICLPSMYVAWSEPEV